MARRDHDRYDIPPRTSGKAIWSLVLGILSFGCTFLTGLPAIILGILGLRDVSRGDGQVTGGGLAIGGIIAGALGSLVCIGLFVPVMIGLLLPAVQKVREAAATMQSSNNQKEIGLAMYAYEDEHGTFPPASLSTRDGRPGLSWRVALLPYLEEDILYRQFKLDEPWDSPNNLPLLQQMPKVYKHPSSTVTDPTLTHYQVFAGPGSLFEPLAKIKLTDVKDGTSNTLMVVEAENVVPWTKPDDLPFNPNGPLPPLGLKGSSRMNFLMADGSVRGVNKSAPPDSIKPAITRAGGEVIDMSRW